MLLNQKGHYTAYGGILTALSLVFLMIASVVPTGRLVFVFLASALVGVAFCLSGVKLSLLCYFATALLSVFFVQNKTYSALYIIAVGNYPVVKLYADSIKTTPVRLIVKTIVFNIYIAVSVAVGTFVLNMNFETKYPFALLWIAMVLLFFVYDNAYSLFMSKIGYVLNKIKK